MLRAEGIRTVLVNSNPATIMTDAGWADRTYLEPLDLAGVESVLRRERPDALLPTLGGQTALNLASQLHEHGILDELGVELIGASYDAIRRAEDRELFAATMASVGLRVPTSVIATGMQEARAALATGALHLPVVVRPAFTLGGHGGGFAATPEEFEHAVERGLRESPISQILLEESVAGWGEFELEVIRDRVDNVIVVCSIENVDPMGVHTGDSATVAPAQTLSDREYQALRDASATVIRAVGVETGGSNVQFALNRETGELVVIEMNPRVSRSSALASKATGYPIAKVATRLAIGYTLDEIPNDITRTTPAAFEPTLDYVVVKLPRFAFEKFPGAETGLTTQMKSVGEVMGIGRTFAEAWGKAMRSRELDHEPRTRGIGRRGRVGPLRRDPGPAHRRRGSGRPGRRVRRPSLVRRRVGARRPRRADAPPDARRGPGRDRLAPAEGARHGRRPDRGAGGIRRGDRPPAAMGGGCAAGLQGGRLLRGGGRGPGAVLLLGLRARGRASRARSGRPSSSSAPAPTGSARGSSSTTAACRPCARSASWATTP